MTRKTGSRNSGHTSAVRSPQLRRTEPGAQVQHLQRTAGNQATARWLRSQFIQPTLTVSRADDKYEREADRVADEVMRMPDLQAPGSIQRAPLNIQRVCTECEEERRGQSVSSEKEKGLVQAKSADASEMRGVTAGLESYLQASHGAGESLPMSARAYFEPRFGHDFSGVRVHTDSRAGSAAAEIDARAFTTGADVYFAPGRFNPGSLAGDRLLAHELTHVVQQSGGALESPPQRDEVQRQPEPPGPPDFPEPDFDCSIDLAARRFQEFVNCCAKTPLGRGCSKDVIEGICKIPGVNCGDKPGTKITCPPGFKPGATKEHKGQCCKTGTPDENARACCAPERIVVNALNPRCCPEGTTPDVAQKNCTTLPPPPPPNLCLPGQQTSKGECCVLPLVPKGESCVLPPPPPPPPRPLPSPLEIFFQKDKPSPKAAGKGALSDSLTAEGSANFKELVAQLQDNPALKVQLVGRASPEGSDEYNMALGRRRALLIAEALEGEGIDPSRIANPPEAELRSECQEVRPGVFTCGEAGATGPKDRQVLSRVFLPTQ